MGGSYTTLKGNGATRAQIEFAYSLIKKHKVVEASEMEYFNRRFPAAAMVEDVEIGDDVDETIVRLPNHGFIAFKGKIKYNTIMDLGKSAFRGLPMDTWDDDSYTGDATMDR